MYIYLCVCVCMCVRACACACACVRLCVYSLKLFHDGEITDYQGGRTLEALSKFVRDNLVSLEEEVHEEHVELMNFINMLLEDYIIT